MFGHSNSKACSSNHALSLRTIVDAPLRVWHLAFATCLCVSLYTGLVSETDRMQLHIWSGLAVIGLLMFRILWAIWGAEYARFRWYVTTPRAVLGFFLGKQEGDIPHTAAGNALVPLLLGAALVQSVAGLFTSDFVLYEGPLARFVSEETVEKAAFIHYRAYWALCALIAIHLLGQLVYALAGSTVPLLMVTGRKRTALKPVINRWMRATGCSLAAAIPVAILAYLLR